MNAHIVSYVDNAVSLAGCMNDLPKMLDSVYNAAKSCVWKEKWYGLLQIIHRQKEKHKKVNC